MKDQLEILRREFFKRLERGIIMSARELATFARRRKLDRHISPKLIKNVRRFWKEMAAFERYRRPLAFQGVSVFRYGLVFIDWAHFASRLRQFNSGCTGFIIAVEHVSGQLHVVPVKNRSRETWQSTIQQIVEDSPIAEINTILSDREGALVSPQFVRKMQEKFAIKIGYLTVRSKAWKAERMIAYVKTYLSKIMKTTGQRRWIDIVPVLLKRYNDMKIPKTSFKRRQVNEYNFHEFLNQKLGVVDVSALHSIGTVSVTRPAWARQVFKFNLGDQVLLTRNIASIVSQKTNRSLLQASSKSSFRKMSEIGAYDPGRSFRVIDRKLKSATGHLLLLPVYRLATLEAEVMLHLNATVERHASTTSLYFNNLLSAFPHEMKVRLVDVYSASDRRPIKLAMKGTTSFKDAIWDFSLNNPYQPTIQVLSSRLKEHTKNMAEAFSFLQKKPSIMYDEDPHKQNFVMLIPPKMAIYVDNADFLTVLGFTGHTKTVLLPGRDARTVYGFVNETDKTKAVKGVSTPMKDTAISMSEVYGIVPGKLEVEQPPPKVTFFISFPGTNKKTVQILSREIERIQNFNQLKDHVLEELQSCIRRLLRGLNLEISLLDVDFVEKQDSGIQVLSFYLHSLSNDQNTRRILRLLSYFSLELQFAPETQHFLRMARPSYKLKIPDIVIQEGLDDSVVSESAYDLSESLWVLEEGGEERVVKSQALSSADSLPWTQRDLLNSYFPLIIKIEDTVPNSFDNSEGLGTTLCYINQNGAINASIITLRGPSVSLKLYFKDCNFKRLWFREKLLLFFHFEVLSSS